MSIETQTSPISAAARFGYIPGLDGIRAIAVMLVIIAHLGLDHIIPGGFGVTVFFFISGFLITRLLLAETGAKGKIALGQFYIRRFLRPLPALYVMLVVTGIILIAMGDMPKLWEAVTAFTYTGNYYYVWLAFQDAAAITATDLRIAPWEHLWSLAVEEHFYLLFPLVLVAFRKTPAKAMWACVAICIAALVWRMTALHILDFPPKYNYAATETRLDSIVYGCLLSLILHVKPDSGFLKRLVGPVPLGLAALVLVACFSYRDEAFRQTFR